MKVVGLTGGIATGKSTVAARLRDLGVPVIDADSIAREIVEPGRPALARIVDAFGPDVLDADGRLDRKAMRARISRDAEARRTLEAITHPEIRAAIGGQLAALAAAGARVAVVEAALMIETGSHRQYDAVLVVTCTPEAQLRRLVERDGHDEAAARALIATQLPLAEKERAATVVIRNDGDRDALRAATDAAWRELLVRLG